jgi:hypothetical protein
MTRYFINIRDGTETITDREGKDYRDLDHAHEEAIYAARDMAAELVREGKVIDGRVIEICDHTGNVVDSFAIRDVVRLQ